MLNNNMALYNHQSAPQTLKYTHRTDSLELWIDIVQIPLEGFALETLAELLSAVNADKRGRE